MGQAYIEGLGSEYDPDRGYRLIEEAAIRHGSVEAANYLLQNKDAAKVYGVNAARVVYLLEEQ